MSSNGLVDDESDNAQCKIDKQLVTKYSKLDLENALRDISKGKTIYAASQEYGVPETTLRRQKKGNVSERGGAKPLISNENEEKLASWIIECNEMGDSRTKGELLIAASEILRQERGSKDIQHLSKGWLHGFLQRHPTISFRTPQTVSKASSKVTEEDIRRYHDGVKIWLEKNNLMHLTTDPSRWINSDETGMEMNMKPSRVLAKKGSKNVSVWNQLSRKNESRQ